MLMLEWVEKEGSGALRAEAVRLEGSLTTCHNLQLLMRIIALGARSMGSYYQAVIDGVETGECVPADSAVVEKVCLPVLWLFFSCLHFVVFH